MSSIIPAANTFPNTNPSSINRILDDLNIYFSLYSSEIKVYDVNAINSMIENILFTIIGERNFEPEFGSNIMGLLYEPCDEQTAKYIELEIFNALTRWMPYIKIDMSKTIAVARPELGEFRVVIYYVILFSGLRGKMNLKLIQ